MRDPFLFIGSGLRQFDHDFERQPEWEQRGYVRLLLYVGVLKKSTFTVGFLMREVAERELLQIGVEWLTRKITNAIKSYS